MKDFLRPAGWIAFIGGLVFAYGGFLDYGLGQRSLYGIGISLLGLFLTWLGGRLY